MPEDEKLIAIRDEILDRIVQISAGNIQPEMILNPGRSSRFISQYRHMAMWAHWYSARCQKYKTAELFNRDPSIVTLAIRNVTRWSAQHAAFVKRRQRLVVEP